MKVELVSKTVGVGRYKGLSNEEIVAAVARHGTIKEDNGKLVVYLMDNKHYSPLQHIFFSFRIETSRAISAQIFRHRSLNFQETSQRYEEITEFEDIEIRRKADKNRQSSEEVFDPILKGIYTSDTVKQFSAAYGEEDKLVDKFKVSYIIQDWLSATKEIYSKLLEAGVAKECARMMLPMASKTTIHVSGTLRDLLAFLNIRMDAHAQLEVRRIAERMGEELEKELPDIFGRLDWRKGMFM